MYKVLFLLPAYCFPVDHYFVHILSYYGGCSLLEVFLGILLLQLSVLAGDFLLSRACVTLASLKNTEVQ